MTTRKDALVQNKQKEKEKIKSLLQIIKNHWPDLIIHEEQIRNPTRESVKIFYNRFYLEFQNVKNGIRTNFLNEEVIPAQNYDDIDLAIRLVKICKLLGIPFNINDICEPQPKRTILYFTLLMNTIVFLKSDTAYLDDIATCVEKDKHHKQLKETQTNLVEDIQSLDLLDAQLNDDMNKVSKDIEDLSKEHKRVIQQKTELDFKYQQDSKLISNLKQELMELNETLCNLKNESVSLQEQIVGEDEFSKLKSDLSDLQKEFDCLDISLSDIMSILEEQEGKVEYYTKCLIPIKNYIFASESFHTLQANLERLTALYKQKQKVDQENDIKEVELKKEETEYASLEKDIKQLEKELDSLNSDTKEKTIKMKTDSENMHLKIKQDEDSSESIKNEIENIKGVCLELETDIEAVKTHFSVKYQELMKQKWLVTERFYDALMKIKNSRNLQP